MRTTLTKILEMDEHCATRSESDSEDAKVNTPLENELEEGEIDEEDDDIYVLAEFERKHANIGGCDNRSSKQDIDERVPFMTFTRTARKTAVTQRRKTVSKFPYERVDERRSREISRLREHRSKSPSTLSFTSRNNNSSRPHMSRYSLQRQSILRSIHKRSRTTGNDSSIRSRYNPSYDELLAEYQDIKSKLRDLIHEEKNLKSDDEKSNEGSYYGDKENRVYRRNGSSRLSRSESRLLISIDVRKSSSSEGRSSIVEDTQNKEEEDTQEEDEEDLLRKIALASKFKCKQSSKLAAPVVNETSVESSNVKGTVEQVNAVNLNIEKTIDVDEDEDLLRAQLLSSLTIKHLEKIDESDVPNSGPASVKSSEIVLGEILSTEINSGNETYKLPVHKPLVINLKEDSDSEQEAEPTSSSQKKIASIDSIDDFLRAARNNSDVSAKDADQNSVLLATPLSVYSLPESELKEYKRLKAEIANREQNSKIKQRNIVLPKTNASQEENLKLAEEKCQKSREALISQEAELKKFVEQLNLHEKTLRATGLKVWNLEQQLTSAKKLELLQKKRVAELKAKKAQLEQQLSLGKSDNLKLQQVCLGIGKVVIGSNYNLPGSVIRLKRLSPKNLSVEKKNKSPIRKIRVRQTSIGTNQGTSNKLSIELAAEKTKLQKKQQELVSKLADLRKQALKATSNKSNSSPITSASVGLQPLKRIRRQSLTKKSKKLRLSESENLVNDLQSKPVEKVDLEKKYAVENTLNMSVSIFEFHYYFADEVPKLELKESSKPLLATSDIISESFLPYRSPLLIFRAYRFSPYFRTKSCQSLSWSTYSHGLKPKVTVCQYDLTGKCNDDKCRWQHAKSYLVSPEECLKDLAQYAPRMIEEFVEVKSGGSVNKLEGFVCNLIQSNQERMTLDEMSVLLVGRVNDYLNKAPPYFITFNERVGDLASNSSLCSIEQSAFEIKLKDDREGVKWRINMELDPDGVCDDSDMRYFDYDTQNSSAIQPTDEEGWLLLAKKKLNCIDSSLDVTLDILSRALEVHSHSSTLWTFYLSLYAKRKDCSELLHLYRLATTLAPNYDIWWQYLQSTKTYADKENLCDEIMRFILNSMVEEEVVSHQLLEILLYWTKLNVLTNKIERAIQILEETLHRATSKSFDVLRLIVEHMTSKDRWLIWLCYISLKVFHSLPNLIFSSESSDLGRVINKLPFILPWQSGGKWHLSVKAILELFMDALRKCVQKGQSAESNLQLCLPLYKNLIALELSRQRNQSAIKVCQQLRKVKSFDEAWFIQACVYYQTGNLTEVRKVLNLALSGTAASPILFYFAVMFEMKEKNINGAIDLCKHCLELIYKQPDLNVNQATDVDALFRHLLNLPCLDKSLILKVARPREDFSQKAYGWLIYCFYLIAQERHADAKSILENAIVRLTDRKDLELIWIHYLNVTFSQTVSLSKMIAIISRCLNSVPCKVKLPGSSGEATYVSYAFINMILDKFISPLEMDLQFEIYEKFLGFVPNNSLLAIRLLSLYIKQGNFQMAWRLCCAQLERTPRKLELWKIALQLAHKNRPLSEIRDVYQHAVQALPFCEYLWKDFHDFEISRGEEEFAKELVTKCLPYGVCIEK